MGSCRQSASDKVGYPSLIFGPLLMRTADTAHPENNGLQAETAGVITDILVCGALRAPIRRVKVKRLVLTHARRSQHRILRFVARAVSSQGNVSSDPYTLFVEVKQRWLRS